MNEVVPRITDNLRARLTANGYSKPVTVPFEHMPDCSFGECWQNVQTTIQREGGSLVAGRHAGCWNICRSRVTSLSIPVWGPEQQRSPF